MVFLLLSNGAGVNLIKQTTDARYQTNLEPLLSLSLSLSIYLSLFYSRFRWNSREILSNNEIAHFVYITCLLYNFIRAIQFQTKMDK